MYIYCYLLDEFFFYSLLISFPISNFIISLFLVFSLLLIFIPIVAFINKRSALVSALLLLPLTSQTFFAVSFIYQYVIYLIAYYHAIAKWRKCLYVDTIFLSRINLFPLRNSPFILHYHLFLYEGCALHVLDINRTLFQLNPWSPLVLS